MRRGVASARALLFESSVVSRPGNDPFRAARFLPWNPRTLAPLGGSAHLRPLASPAPGRGGRCRVDRQWGASPAHGGNPAEDHPSSGDAEAGSHRRPTGRLDAAPRAGASWLTLVSTSPGRRGPTFGSTPLGVYL